ncbi:helix-turn-helix domain-containing protein [Streptomyces sp. FXJ1.172]|uniref:MmyB family transcriptional regulator n=1 Tax=Streptomyces sp. FXJ1.172 TaxID=710705 RepID=UPI0007CF3139|nr:helix-turn-helix domain-containing protein [Streptomyces sp. FXJ1.172]WEO95505.1 helix-turn-helix domain-containing protein [Streptomyces sp. FXJ1.172]
MNKRALKALLKDRRALIAPETHGLTRPTGPGRRAPGLSQLQVDQLLNRAYGTYHRLESGTYPSAPVDLLRDIARLFALNEQEWISLCRYARGEDPPSPLYDTSGDAVPAAWEDAVTGVTHPTYVTDASWNLLTCNEPFHRIFESGQAPENTMRWMLIDGREQLTDWANAWAPLVMPQLQAALAQRPDDKVLRQIEKELLDDPLARPLYEVGGASIHPDGDERPIRHAVEGPGWVTMCVAQPLAAPGSRFMILIFRPGPRRSSPRPPMLQAR